MLKSRTIHGKIKVWVQCLYCSQYFYGYGHDKNSAIVWALQYRAYHFYEHHFKAYVSRFKDAVNEKVSCNPVPQSAPNFVSGSSAYNPRLF